jgi:hypothetical protein
MKVKFDEQIEVADFLQKACYVKKRATEGNRARSLRTLADLASAV